MRTLEALDIVKPVGVQGYAELLSSTCNLVEQYDQGSARVRIFDGAYSKKVASTSEKVFSDRVTLICFECIRSSENRKGNGN